MKSLALLFLLFSMCSTWAQARIRYPHPHDDIINEGEFYFGLKAGPQLTRYSQALIPLPGGGESETKVKPSLRYFGGVALTLVYAIPRIELNLLWSVRSGINVEDTYNSLALPLMLKFPLSVLDDVDLEAGVGYQPELMLFGPGDPKGFLHGFLGSLGFSYYLPSWIFQFEFRYVFGTRGPADDIKGAVPQDLQVVLGPQWQF